MSNTSNVYPGGFKLTQKLEEEINSFMLKSPMAKAVPNFSVYDHKDVKEIWIDLPGVSIQDIDVSLADRIILIRACKNLETDTVRYETRFRIPNHADSWFIHGSFHAGTLKIKIPINSVTDPCCDRKIIVY